MTVGMLPPKQAVIHTAHSFPPPNTVGPGPLIWDVVRGPILPPRGTKERDRILRMYDSNEYNNLWMGVTSGIIKKIASVQFEIRGPDSQYYQDMLGYAQFGHGWEYLLKLVLRDFLSQSYGGIFELAGPGDPDTPLIERPTGINHLDAFRCYVTGNPIYPLLYYSLWDGKLHRMHASRVYMLVDDPSPDERYFGIGRCALERCISVSQREMRMGQYIDTLLDDKPQPGILGLTGVADTAWQILVQKYMREQNNDERPVFGRTIVLTSLDPNAPVKAEVIPFSQTPEKFDFVRFVDLDVNAMAVGLGIDRMELWELSGRGLGTGGQSNILAMKARTKLYADIFQGIERFMNWAMLPDDCEFSFKQKDEQSDQMRSSINLQIAQTAQVLAAVGIQPTIIAKYMAGESEEYKAAFANEKGQIIATSTSPGLVEQIAAEGALTSHTPLTDKPVPAPSPVSSVPKQLGAPSTTPAGNLPATVPKAAVPVPMKPKAPQTTLKTLKIKVFSDTSNDFMDQFSDIVDRAIDGKVRLKQASNLLTSLMYTSGTKAFQDGLELGGVDEMDEDDQATVQDWLTDVSVYVDSFLDSVYGGRVLKEQVDLRAVMWVNKSLSQMLDAGRISADRNGYYIWEMGATEKHCIDCQRLDGQIHRFKEWYTRDLVPKSDQLSCNGFRCDCRLRKAVGPGFGRF